MRNYFTLHLFIHVTSQFVIPVLETFRRVNFVDYLPQHLGKAKSSNSLGQSFQIQLSASYWAFNAYLCPRLSLKTEADSQSEGADTVDV